jgi:hypothetical protein
MDYGLFVENMGLFTMAIEPQEMSISSLSDMASLQWSVTLKSPTAWDISRFGKADPTLLELYGMLRGVNDPPPIGAILLPPERLPLPLRANVGVKLLLSFSCPRSYLEYLEEKRTVLPRQDLQLMLSVRGVLALESPPDAFTAQMGHFISFQTQDGGVQVRVPRSHWTDGLASIGYPKRTVLELSSLDPEKMVVETQEAVKHVNEAYDLFLQERYREAVQRCRQVRDALLDPQKTTWSQTHLVPVIGVEKATMIDDCIKAFKHLGDSASHGSNTLEIDRDAAEFIIRSFTLILSYIDRKLR